MAKDKEKREPEKKKLSLKDKLRTAFNGVSRKELLSIAKDTLKDLRRPQEIALLVGCSFLPGGWIGYGIYRVAKYKQKKAANDNPDKPAPKHLPGHWRPPAP